MWFKLLIGLLFTYINYLLTPKPKGPKPADEISGIPTVEEGSEIVYVRGTAWNDGAQVAWWGDMKTKKIKA